MMIKRIRRSMLALAMAAIALAAIMPPASAQDFPTRPVRLMIPFSPGGAADVLCRILGQALSKHWGQPVIVENRPGGNTIVGTAAAVNSTPDGYTLLFAGDQSITINPLLTKTPYSVEKDIAPISLIALNPLMLTVINDLPAKTLPEFIALAKAKPKTITYGSSGAGSAQRLAMEHFAQQAGIELVHVPYRGSNETVADMLAGNVQSTFNGVSNFVQLLEAGKLRAIALAPGHRSQQLPNVPSVREVGAAALKDFDVLSWFGLFAPAGVPKAIRDKIEADVMRVMRTPDTEKQLAARGFELVAGSAEDFRKVIEGDTARWREVIRKGNITE